jgi:hypothetical protein
MMCGSGFGCSCFFGGVVRYGLVCVRARVKNSINRQKVRANAAESEWFCRRKE